APALPPEELAYLRPFAHLTDRLASLHSQLFGGRAGVIELDFEGQLAQHDTNLLVAAAIKGVMQNFTEDRINAVNARLIASRRRCWNGCSRWTACPTCTTSSFATEAPIADVRALPGIRYADTAHLTRLVAPPYDVIPDADIAGYLERSPHNVIRLIRPGHDYDGAARTLDAWLQDGTLRADDPSMYVHEVDLGDGRTRRDLLAALRLEPYDRRVVL